MPDTESSRPSSYSRADLNDPAYWRARAEEARQYAETFTDDGARQSMLGVAETYERLAKLAEKAALVRDVRPKS